MLSPSRIRSLPVASPVKCRLLALLLSALLLIVLDCTLLLHEPGQSQGSPRSYGGAVGTAIPWLPLGDSTLPPASVTAPPPTPCSSTASCATTPTQLSTATSTGGARTSPPTRTGVPSAPPKSSPHSSSKSATTSAKSLPDPEPSTSPSPRATSKKSPRNNAKNCSAEDDQAGAVHGWSTLDRQRDPPPRRPSGPVPAAEDLRTGRTDRHRRGRVAMRRMEGVGAPRHALGATGQVAFRGARAKRNSAGALLTAVRLECVASSLSRRSTAAQTAPARSAERAKPWRGDAFPARPIQVRGAGHCFHNAGRR